MLSSIRPPVAKLLYWTTLDCTGVPNECTVIELSTFEGTDYVLAYSIIISKLVTLFSGTVEKDK